MLLFPLLKTLDTELSPTSVKVHLASWNGSEDPLAEFLQGRFEDWQSYQTRAKLLPKHCPRFDILARG